MAAVSPDLEDAVEAVVRWLADHGVEDLARQVAVATDPESDERSRTARAVAAVVTARPTNEEER